MLRFGMELNIEQKQTLTLTPQLLQAIHILGLARDELEHYIEDELESNPALEADWGNDSNETTESIPEHDKDGMPGPDLKNADQEIEYTDERVADTKRSEDFDWAEYLKEKGYDDVSYRYGSLPDSLPDRGGGQKLSEYLLEQLTAEGLGRISANSVRAYEIAASIIDLLDENGFLPHDASEIMTLSGASKGEALAAVSVLKELDPAGVAATDVREALEIQYIRAGGADPLVIDIIRTRLADVATRSAAVVARSMGRRRQEVERVFRVIASLDPRPCRGFYSGAETHYIIPDIIIEKNENGYEAKLNESHQPMLMVSPYYRKILTEAEKGSEEYLFLTERLNAAAALIKSLEQRGQTIYKVVAEILKRQDAFFEGGEACLKPMTQKQIADEIGVHESTVSRAIRGKYAQTPQGTIELKQLFSAGVTTVDGEGAAATSIKTKISLLTKGEDKRRPLSDKMIADLLVKDGIMISRRTIAKYRQEVGIASSAKRAQK